ncbi:hypothetical protein JNW89_32160 [Micromonospora sp. 4G55]|nr:hypothetical protein [Micromonospora sp. 4G55]
MNKEDFIIKAFLNEKNGDDGAVIDDWCFSKDLFFENVHFKRAWLSLEQIATKSNACQYLRCHCDECCAKIRTF